MNDNRKQHAPMNQFACRDGELLIGDIPLRRLAMRVGQTPFFAYDRQVIRTKVGWLRANLPPTVTIHYAVKANPMPAVVQFLSTLVDGMDVASGGELRVALDAGVSASVISIAGPGKTLNELRMAVAAGATINLESENELASVVAISRALDIRANVAVRVNPDFVLGSSGMKMGGGSQQFGLDVERVPHLLEHIATSSLNFVGLHIFTGSQNLNHEAIVKAHQNIFDLAGRLLRNCPTPVRILNIGGGFGIPYFPGDKPLDLAPIGAGLLPLTEAFHVQHPDAEVVVELGRFLVGDSGVYVCEVLDKKVSRGEIFVVANGGLHHHLAASGNFGQVIRKNYPVTIGNKVSSPRREIVNVVGPLCTPLDFLARQLDLPEAEVGDLVVVYQSGAYGYSASPRGFLSHPSPVEILV